MYASCVVGLIARSYHGFRLFLLFLTVELGYFANNWKQTILYHLDIRVHKPRPVFFFYSGSKTLNNERNLTTKIKYYLSTSRKRIHRSTYQSDVGELVHGGTSNVKGVTEMQGHLVTVMMFPSFSLRGCVENGNVLRKSVTSRATIRVVSGYLPILLLLLYYYIKWHLCCDGDDCGT